MVLSLAYFFGAAVTGIPIAVGMTDNLDDESKLTTATLSAFAKPEAYAEPEIGALLEDEAIAAIYWAVVFVAACYYAVVIADYSRRYSGFLYPFALIWSLIL